MARKSINWNEWLSPQRVITLLILAAVAILLFWILWRKVSNTAQNIIGGIRENRDFEDEISATGTTPSYPNNNYKMWADQLEVAMYGAGTDEAMIYQVFSMMKNDADVIKLIDAFGSRKGFLQWNATTLPQWIQGDLRDRTELNNILKQKGISYRF